MNEAETQRWLRYAVEDLTAATKMIVGTDNFPRHACWLAQQAAEKALKAGLIFCDHDFPFTHDLDRLRNLLPDSWHVRDQCPDLAELTEWAVEARYPGDLPEATLAEAEIAVQQATGVITSVRTDIIFPEA